LNRLSGSEQDAGDGAIDEYWGWVKAIVRNHSLEWSIKFRVLQDTVKGELEEAQLGTLDAQSRVGLALGTVTCGAFELTLRETCNKIIHAGRVVPQWATAEVGGVEFNYWNGTLELSGDRDASP
jgi:hypothetical protein